jgi:hypothetical protein
MLFHIVELGKTAEGSIAVLAALDTAALAVDDQLDLLAELLRPVDISLFGVVEVIQGPRTVRRVSKRFLGSLDSFRGTSVTSSSHRRRQNGK